MLIVYILMIAAGLAAMGFGFWTLAGAKHPLDKIGPVLLPVGLVVALLGVLLAVVPNFFKS
ncbi:MAG: hypothetical protein RQ824_02465 [bacterium]|nr:hypothetical protein [bacterium]